MEYTWSIARWTNKSTSPSLAFDGAHKTAFSRNLLRAVDDHPILHLLYGEPILLLFSCPEQLNRTHCPSLGW